MTPEERATLIFPDLPCNDAIARAIRQAEADKVEECARLAERALRHLPGEQSVVGAVIRGLKP